MKQILFIITSFRHGGTNKSLENLLSLIDTDNFKADVFAMEHYGPYKEMLPNCTILPEDKWLSALISHWNDTMGFAKLRSTIIKLLRIASNYLKINFIESLYRKSINNLIKDKKYDTVIAYSEGVPTVFLSYLNHENKIAWIHCDYSSYMKLNNNPDETKLYESYKSIVCVSEFTKNVFCKIMPEFKIKTYSIHNLVNIDIVNDLSLHPIDDKRFIKRKFNIISIGRIDIVKRFDVIPEIVNKLKDKNIDFIWYLLGPKGSGLAQNKFENSINKYKINDNFIWLGSKDNPYNYLMKSDLLVVTSTSEACPYVLNEAKVLNIPIITTNYSSAVEFIEDGINGFIVPLEKIADRIEKIILNNEIYDSIKHNLSTNGYDNNLMLNKIYSLVV
ncbi:MAG: glycosyltransferase [Bacteroidales bacterium]